LISRRTNLPHFLCKPKTLQCLIELGIESRLGRFGHLLSDHPELGLCGLTFLGEHVCQTRGQVFNSKIQCEYFNRLLECVVTARTGVAYQNLVSLLATSVERRPIQQTKVRPWRRLEVAKININGTRKKWRGFDKEASSAGVWRCVTESFLLWTASAAWRTSAMKQI